MTLVSSSIPNLFNGVSQQAPQLRLNSQCEAQENALSSLAQGLTKRPALDFLEELYDASTNKPFSYFIDNNDDQQYVVVVDGPTIRVFDLDGDEQTVTYQDQEDVLLSRDPSLNLLSVPFVLHIPGSNKTISLNTAIEDAANSFNLIWEYADNEAFTTNVTQMLSVSSDTSEFSSSSDYTWSVTLNGKWIRARSTHSNASNDSVAVSASVEHRGTSYLVSGNQKDDLKSATIGNTSFLCNTGMTVGLLPLVWDFNPAEAATGDDFPSFLTYETKRRPAEILMYVRQIPVTTSGLNSRYNFILNRDSNGAITQQFFKDIGNDKDPVFYTNRARGDFEQDGVGAFLDYTRGGQVLHITRILDDDNTYKPFEMTVTNVRNEGIILIPNEIERYTDLPSTGPDGFHVLVRGSADSRDDDYYVEFVRTEDISDSLGQGYWRETTAPLLQNHFDPRTMPHTLEITDSGEFVYGRPEWSPRTVGDENTAPPPSFAGNTINQMFVSNDRLSFLSGSNLVMSQYAEALTFWRETALTILETDPIDIEVSSQTGDGSLTSPVLVNAVHHNEHLILFSSRTQYTVSGGDFLSPTNISAPLTTEFDASAPASPVAAGKDLYFASNSGDYSIIREYFVDPESGVNNSVNITSHVPLYIPKDAEKILASPTGDTLWVISREEPGTLYTYTYFWQGNTKVQSSWSKWTFADAEILNIASIADDLFLLVQYEDRGKVVLCRMDLNSELTGGGENPPVHLDLRVDEGQCTAIAVGFTHSFITPPYTIKDGSTYAIVSRKVDDDDDPTGTIAHTVVAEEGVTYTALTNELLVPGDHWEDEGNPFYFGEAYRMTYEFSQLIVKEQRGGGQEVAIAGDNVTVRTFLVDYVDTGTFNLEVTPGHTGVTSVHPVAPQVNDQGHPVATSGIIRRNVLSRPINTRVAITNDSHLPCSLLSAGWEAEYERRSRRI